MIKRLFFSVIVLMAFSCQFNENKKTIEPVDEALKVDKNEAAILEDFTEFVLDERAKKIVNKWNTYSELIDILENAKKGNLSFFKVDKAVFDTYMKKFEDDDLDNSLPEEIETPAIIARIHVIETLLYKFEDVVNLSTSKEGEIKNLIRELVIATSNFNLLVNKKLEKEAQQNVLKP